MDITEHTADSTHSASETLQNALKTVVPPDALRTINGLPDLLRTELRERPYRTLGVVLALGVGIGAMASSRVTRFLVMNLGSFALTEIARRGARQYLDRMLLAR